MENAILLIIHVLFVVGIFVTIKLSNHNKQNTYQILSVNYLIATVISYFECKSSVIDTIYQASCLVPFSGIIIGSFFILNFLLMFASTQKVGIGITTVLNKTSLIIPVIIGYFFLGQTNSALNKLIGVAICIFAFYFIFYSKSNNTNKSISIAALLLPISVFFASGFTDTSMEVVNKFVLSGQNQKSVFLLLIFGTAFFLSVILVITDALKGSKFKLSVLLYGSALGSFNYMGSKMLLINVERMGGSIVFPVLNASVVILTTIVGYLFFKETFTKRQWTGIALAVASVAVIASTLAN